MPVASKIPSGVDLIDQSWGGLNRGGVYVLHGDAVEESRLITTLFVQAGARRAEPILVAAVDDPGGAITRAVSLDPDLRRAHDEGRLRLVRLPLSDADPERALTRRRLVDALHEHRPDRVVVIGLAALLPAVEHLPPEAAAAELLAHLRAVSATTLLAPSTVDAAPAQRAVDAVRSGTAGTILVTRTADGGTSGRRISITPTAGHVRRQVVEQWEPQQLWEVPPASSAPPSPPAPQPDRRGEAEEADPDPPTRHDAATTPPAPRFEEVRPSTLETAYVPRKAPPPPPTYRPHTHYAPPGTRPAGAEEQASAPADAPHGTDAPPSPERVSSDGGQTLPPTPTVTWSQEAAAAVPADGGSAERDAFRARLQQHYLRRDVHGAPFVLLAVRMNRQPQEVARPFDFEFLTDLSRDQLGPEDDLYVDAARERLVLLLADATPEAADDFFARLRTHLREETPEEADRLLHAVAAIVVPDGKPFQNAEEFLTYALDEGRVSN